MLPVDDIGYAHGCPGVGSASRPGATLGLNATPSRHRPRPSRRSSGRAAQVLGGRALCGYARERVREGRDVTPAMLEVCVASRGPRAATPRPLCRRWPPFGFGHCSPTRATRAAPRTTGLSLHSVRVPRHAEAPRPRDTLRRAMRCSAVQRDALGHVVRADQSSVFAGRPPHATLDFRCTRAAGLPGVPPSCHQLGPCPARAVGTCSAALTISECADPDPAVPLVYHSATRLRLVAAASQRATYVAARPASRLGRIGASSRPRPLPLRPRPRLSFIWLRQHERCASARWSELGLGGDKGDRKTQRPRLGNMQIFENNSTH